MRPRDQIEKWDAGLGQGDFLSLLKLEDGPTLQVYCRVMAENPPWRSLKFTFQDVAVYRVTTEWQTDGQMSILEFDLGPLLQIKAPSTWKEELAAKGHLFAAMFNRAKHRILVTESKIIEVISNGEPKIEELAPIVQLES